MLMRDFSPALCWQTRVASRVALHGTKRRSWGSKISLRDDPWREFSEPPRALGAPARSARHSAQVSDRHPDLAVARDTLAGARMRLTARDKPRQNWDCAEEPHARFFPLHQGG